MKYLSKTFLGICAVVIVSACSSQPKTESSNFMTPAEAPQSKTRGEVANSALPKAVIYKTNGNYNNNVPITLNASGSAIFSYPAPSDITSTSTPLQLTGGYLLDRRGLGKNTAFTTYTYSEYSRLQSAPSIAELYKAIIPEAKVTEKITLPMTLIDAEADTAAVNAYIREHLMVMPK